MHDSFETLDLISSNFYICVLELNGTSGTKPIVALI